MESHHHEQEYAVDLKAVVRAMVYTLAILRFEGLVGEMESKAIHVLLKIEKQEFNN